MKRSFNRSTVALFATGILFAGAGITADSKLDVAATRALRQAIADPHRSEADRARDSARHPEQTLTFFGMLPSMTVVEIWPEPGWYSQIIAPYLGGHGGKYIAALGSPDGSDKFTAKFSAPRYGRPQITYFSRIGMESLKPGTVDMVVTFRNLHNWMADGWSDQAFATIYTVLKPGGVLGLVDHRASDSRPQDPKAADGYVREDYAIAAAKRAGFVFEQSSPVNNNPKDTKDHPFGVWTLPPTLLSAPFGVPAASGFDHAKYLRIGESDRFTLRFRKPLK